MGLLERRLQVCQPGPGDRSWQRDPRFCRGIIHIQFSSGCHRAIFVQNMVLIFSHVARKLEHVGTDFISKASRKSYVEFDDGDRGLIPNGWIHKRLRLGRVPGGLPKFGGSYLIHWDSKLRQRTFDIFSRKILPKVLQVFEWMVSGCS